MALSVVDLYRDILPKTNCRDCGFSTCLAFASMVVSEQHPIKNCPHLTPEVVAACEKELAVQYAAGKWLKRDMKTDALKWAKEKSASMKIQDLPDRIGGTLIEKDGEPALELPYFNDHIIITRDGITRKDGAEMTRYEQVFIYNLMFWDAEATDGFGAETKLSFDDTITQHLDIESIMFLSERLREILCEFSG